MQTLCGRCQAILARILDFQLGDAESIYLGDVRILPLGGPGSCVFCQLFTEYIKDGKQLLVRRAPSEQAVGRSSDAVFLRSLGDLTAELSQSDVAIEVQLKNAQDLRKSGVLATGNVHQLVLQGSNRRRTALAQAAEWLTFCSARRTIPHVTMHFVVMKTIYRAESWMLVDGLALSGKYAGLSHCWGAGCELKTTRATLRQRYERIPVTALPSLFQDAVFCARELGIAYLWIDALCIVQDDHEEWEREAAQMADIFRNAYVTFAATAQPNSDCPLFPPSDYAALQFKVLDTGAVFDWNVKLQPKAKPRDDILNAPLNHRGWVLQELMLSRRTLHFAKHQVYWHCAELAQSADGVVKDNNGQLSTLGWWYGPDAKLGYIGGGGSKTWLPHGGAHRYEVVKAVRPPPPPPMPPSRGLLWWRLVEDYSTRKLSFLSDKLVALAGIAAAFREQDASLGCPAEMWEHDIISSLLWYVDATSLEADNSPRPSGLASIPSWSWASIDKAVRMPRGYGSVRPVRTLASVEEVEVQYAGTSLASQVTGGTLRIRGHLVRVTHRLYDGEGQGYYDDTIAFLSYTCQDNEHEHDPIGRGRADVTYLSLRPELWLLPVFEDRDGQLSVLLLQRHSDDGTFQRVGIGVVYKRVVVPEGKALVTIV